jgi:hypothetical protein
MIRSAGRLLRAAVNNASTSAAGAAATQAPLSTSARLCAPSPTVFDRMVQLFAIDGKGNRHAINALEGQTVAEALSDSGLFPDDAFMPNVWETCSVDCHVFVAGEFLAKLPPLSEEDAERQASAIADYARGTARDNSRFGKFITVTPELNGMTVALGSIEPWKTW